MYDDPSPDSHTGSCLCGDVRFRILGPLHDTNACHCDACRRWSGHFWASVNTTQTDLVIENGDASIAWYPEKVAERGFCVICGSSLFFRPLDHTSNHVEVSLGAIDGATGVTLNKHIFAREKGDYYDLPETAEIYQGDDK